MEGSRLRLGHAQLGQSVTHLEGCTLGEGHGQHVGGIDGANGRAVGDAVGDRARLTRAGAREDSEGPGNLGGDGTLVGVKGVKQFLGVHASIVPSPTLSCVPCPPARRADRSRTIPEAARMQWRRVRAR